jgi:zinc D-Ala-D-Ala carboxypeptidase
MERLVLMKLTPHFSEEELNVAGCEQRVIQNALFLCNEVLEPIREHVMRPLIITSGFRTSDGNKATGGALNSQHLFTGGDAAVDFRISAIPNSDLHIYFDWIRLKSSLWKVDQVILEFNKYDEKTNLYTEPRIIHVSTNRNKNPRNQAMLGLTHGRGKYTKVPFEIAKGY